MKQATWSLLRTVMIVQCVILSLFIWLWIFIIACFFWYSYTVHSDHVTAFYFLIKCDLDYFLDDALKAGKSSIFTCWQKLVLTLFTYFHVKKVYTHRMNYNSLIIRINIIIPHFFMKIKCKRNALDIPMKCSIITFNPWLHCHVL